MHIVTLLSEGPFATLCSMSMMEISEEEESDTSLTVDVVDNFEHDKSKVELK